MNDDQPHFTVVVRPQLQQQDDKSWRACYPEADWCVTAETREAATQKLHDEYARRLNAGEIDTQPGDDLLERHLAQPFPGVYAIDSDVYMKIRRSPNFRQELDKLIEQMDEGQGG